MALMTRKELDTYVHARNDIAKAAKAAVVPELRDLDYSDIALARDNAIRIMDGHLRVATDASASLSAEMYDIMRERATGETDYHAEAISNRDPQATAGFVRAAIQDVVKDDNVDGFVNKCASRCGYEVQKAAGECMYENGLKDRKIVRFARVPGGGETCRFCIMLASRGAVYYSRKSAGEDKGHYHDNCQCTIQPVFMQSKHGAADIVEGYDPKKYKDMYDTMIENGDLSRAELAAASKYAKERRGRSISRTEGTEGTLFPTGTRAMIRYLNGATDRQDFERRAIEVKRDFDTYWADKRDWQVIKREIDKIERRFK